MNKENLPQINVGETLRMARERTGQDLRYVADMLRIRYVYLEAIEKGDYQKLPGATYAIGFVRAYADHLNLNSVEIVERFKQEQDDLDQQTQLVFPKPLPEGKVPSGGILLVALVLGVFVYGAWFFLSGQDKPIAELIPEIPSRLMALVGAGEDEDGMAEPPATAGEDEAEAAEDIETDEQVATAPDTDAAMSQAAPDEAAEEAPAPVEAAPDPMPAPAPEETAATADEDVAAEAGEPDPAATADAPAAVEEIASDPAIETDAVDPDLAEPESMPEAEAPAAGETVAETPAADGPVAAQATGTPDAGTTDAARPIDAAEADPAAEAEPAGDDETAVAETPAPSDTRGPGDPETVEATAADDDAAAIAQRVLDELGDVDEPTASPPPAAAGDTPAPDSSEALVNGDTAGADAPAAGAEQPAGEVPVAAITPAARTQDQPAAEPASPSIAAAPPGGKIYGTEYAQSRILITARVDSWVEVSTQQGELLLTRVLRAGDSFRVPDQGGLSLVTGNAGGLAISVDGAQVPDLGPVGAVRRGVELDPDRLKAGTAGNL